jgi:hypothetical protein
LAYHFPFEQLGVAIDGDVGFGPRILQDLSNCFDPSPGIAQMIVNGISRDAKEPASKVNGAAVEGTQVMHDLEKDSRSHILGRVAVKQPAHAIAKDIVVMHQIKPGKGVRVAARSSDQTNMFAFANGQICLPSCSFFAVSDCHRDYKRAVSDCHRDYKRMSGTKRCRKYWRS